MNPSTEPASDPAASPSPKPRFAYAIATAFGTGYLKPAPGTWGTVFGLVVAVLSHPLTWFLLLGASFQLMIGKSGALQIGLGGRLLLLAPTILVWAALAYFGVRSGEQVAKFEGVKDPQHVVIDEVSGVHLAMILALAPTSPLTLVHPEDAVTFALYSGMSILNWEFLLAAFILFRIFDIAKPFPCRHLENLPGGWGIMADDWMAGVYAAICLRIALHFHWL